MTLSPAAALLIFTLAVIAGVNFRRAWKAEAPRWQLWLFGGVAALCLCVVGFLPVDVG